MSGPTTARLVELMEEAAEHAITIDRADLGAGSIRKLGIDSKTMLAFMVAVEDAFGFEWDDDIDPDTLASFADLAAYLDATVLA